jgi:iron complex transport system substrate-binding protein
VSRAAIQVPQGREQRTNVGTRIGSVRDIEETIGHIVDSAYHIHRGLGPGLFESVYERLLARDLTRRGFHVERQKGITFEFNGEWFEDGFRADLLVDHSVLVEVKSVERLAPIHFMQMRTYLRLLNCPAGMLINFNAPLIKNGIKRLNNT